MTSRERIHARLQELYQRDHRLTPEAVIADAEQRTSPLHNEFEWDDEVAAHQHRLNVARTLIRSVRVQVTIDSKIVQSVAYVHDPALPRNEMGYVQLAEVKTSRELSVEVLQIEIARARGLLERALEIAQSLSLLDEQTRLIAALEALG